MLMIWHAKFLDHKTHTTVRFDMLYEFSSAVTCPPLTRPDNGRIECSLGDDGPPLKEAVVFTYVMKALR